MVCAGGRRGVKDAGGKDLQKRRVKNGAKKIPTPFMEWGFFFYLIGE